MKGPQNISFNHAENVNIGDNGIINSKSVIESNVDSKSLENQMENLFNEIRKAGTGLSGNQKEEMDEYIETIQEVIKQDKPKKGIIRTACKWLKELCTEPKFIEAVSKLAPVIQKMITGE